MKINYEKIQQSIDEYGLYILNCIKNQYNSSLSHEQLKNIENLLSTEFIVIEKPSQKDIEFFSKQEGISNPENYSSQYIPTAHGGRTKEDNKIHIYPYTKSFSNCKNDEEIIESCIDGIVIHEIFHYFIKPGLSSENETIKDEFGHFITEGLVQYYTEEFAKKNRLSNPKSNYEKNVEFVKQLISSFPDDLNQNQIDKIIFTYNQDELLNIAKNGNLMYEEYVADVQFKEGISSFITNMFIDMGIDKDEKNLKDTIKHYKKVDDVNIIFNELRKNIELAFKDNVEMRDGYMLKLINLFSDENLKRIGKSVDVNIDMKKINTFMNSTDTMQGKKL